MAKETKKPEKAPEVKEGSIEPAAQSRGMSPLDEIERAFADYLPRGWMHRWGWPSWGELTRPLERLAPRVDVIDRDDEVVVHAEVPGVDKKDLEVSLTENALTIKGSNRREEKEEKGDYYRSEIAYGSFSRSVSLPSAVDVDKARASFKDGVLELRVPKMSKAKRRSVKVD